MQADFISIGRTLKTFGLNGELKLEITEHFISDLLDAPAVFFLERGKHLPFFIQNVKGTAQQPIIQLEEVTTKESATRFSSKEIFLRKSDIAPENLSAATDESELEYGHLENYNIVNTEGVIIGIIESIEEYPQQEMAHVKRSDDSILIPLNDHFILEIDEEKKVVVMELPEGLI